MPAGFPDKYTQLWGHTLVGEVVDDDSVLPAGITVDSPLEEAIQYALENAGGGGGGDGDSAYQVAVDEGFVGDETAWLASLVGADGANGADGTNGTNGAQGPIGATGAAGAAGAAGPGLPSGGTVGQIAVKASGTDYDTGWVDTGVTNLAHDARWYNNTAAGAALNDAIVAGLPILLPIGAVDIEEPINIVNPTHILGSGVGQTVLTFTDTGATAAFQNGESARIYGCRFENFAVIADTGVTCVGFDWDSISTSTMVNVAFEGFTDGVSMNGDTGGESTCLYNTFTECNFRNNTVGVRIDDQSNSNWFYGCLIAANTTAGMIITKANQISMFGGAFEANTAHGLLLDASAANFNRMNTFMGMRFEANSPHWEITDPDTARTTFVGNFYDGGTGPTDSSDTTQRFETPFSLYSSTGSTTKPVLSGTTNTTAAMLNLITILENFGLIEDSTTEGLDLVLNRHLALGTSSPAPYGGTGGDWNAHNEAGISNRLLLGNGTNGPTSTSDYFYAWNIKNLSDEETSKTTQIAIPYVSAYNDADNVIYIRSYFTTWTSWSRIAPVVLDEDDLTSDSATAVPSQQSVKAYVDTNTVPANGNVGFHGTTPIAQQTGVGTDAASIHAALVALGLITA